MLSTWWYLQQPVKGEYHYCYHTNYEFRSDQGL